MPLFSDISPILTSQLLLFQPETVRAWRNEINAVLEDVIYCIVRVKFFLTKSYLKSRNDRRLGLTSGEYVG